jgi:HSP20 family protein
MQIDWQELWKEVHDLGKELQASRLFPPINCLETATGFQYEIILVGYQKTDLQLKWEGFNLTISALPAPIALQAGEQWIMQEYTIQPFERAIVLPTETEPEKLQAKFENSILYVFLPKLNE